jgi:hypothetical protein
MRRSIVIAAFLVGTIVPSPLKGQFRSAPRSIGFSAAGMARSFAPIRPMPVSVRMGTTRPISFVSQRAPFGRRFFPHRRFLLGWPLSYPYAGYPSYFSYLVYPPAVYPSVEQLPAALEEQDNALAAQLEKLTNEVEALREEQTSRDSLEAAARAPQGETEVPPLPTVFVYRDGRRFEAGNYAILGQTLWVFGEQTTRRISLADLDLPASKRLNGERGVDFPRPDASARHSRESGNPIFTLQ